VGDEEIIRAYCQELWNDHDVSAIRRWSHPDGVLHDYPGKPELLKADEIERRLDRIFDLIPNHNMTIHDLWRDGNGDVVWRWSVRGTWNGPWCPGSAIDFSGVTWYRLEAEKIVRRYGVGDAYLFDYQIGKRPQRIDIYLPV